MKRHFRDIFSDIVIFFIRPIIVFLMKREIDVVHKGEIIQKDREPFILISNHFNTWDAFVVMNNVKKNIRFVATEVAFLDFAKKIGMMHLARAIKKRVGKMDYTATKRIFTSLKQGYAVGLFPEGDNTFYGETLDMYQSTGKLLKRAKVDVILIKQQGGYVSQPRWADFFSKKGVIYTETKFLLKKEELLDLTEQQINKIVEEAIYNNDYDFQREKMFDFAREKRAEGIERLVYRCNKCGSILSIYGQDHDIMCSKCGKIGYINEYEFIEGNNHDNLVDYTHEMYEHIEDVINSTFHFDITLNTVNLKKLKNKSLGKYTVHYEDKILTLINDSKEKIIFEIQKMKYPVNTMRHSFSFDYEEKTYNFTDIRHQFVLYEMCRYLNGSYKE